MIAQLDRSFVRARPWKVWSRLVAYLLFEGRPLTARGQWINPIVLAGCKVWANLKLDRPPDRPIIVMGVGRSGTTLLGKVLGLHPSVGFLNEPKALWHAAIGNEDIIGTYTKETGVFRLSRQDATKPKVRRLRRFYSVFGKISGAKRVLDKYPETIFRNDFLDQAFPDCKKVVLIRDGWQTIASVASWSAKHCDGTSDWWGRRDQKWRAMLDQMVRPDPYFADIIPSLEKDASQAERAAIEWIITMREVISLRQTQALNLQILRFEDFVAAPRAHVAALLDFCELDWDKTVLDYASANIKRPKTYPAPEIDVLIARKVQEVTTSIHQMMELDA